MKINYFLRDIAVNPVRREEIYLEINHDQESVINQPRPHVGINNLRFAREDVAKIMGMLNQPPGITEGIPFDIVIEERGQKNTINMYLDLMEGLARSDDGITATVKMVQSLDWLDAKVDAFTFESMYNEPAGKPFTVDGISYPSYKDYFDKRFIYIPYVISSIPNWQDAFMAIFAITYVAVELKKSIVDIIKDLTPSVCAVGPVVHIAQLVLQIAFTILLLVTLVGLITQLINCLIQKIKYHGAMLMSDLLKIAAVKLGLNAQSSIWDSYPYNQVAFLPEKYNTIEIAASGGFDIVGNIVGAFGIKGYETPSPAQRGYYNGTGGDFLRLIKSVCNGKIIIPDQSSTLLLERRDFFPASSPYKLTNVRQDWNGYNTDELTANILIAFAVDLNEKNCIDFFDKNGNAFYPGTILQATHQQVTTINKNLVCLKGLREINLPVARGAAKDRLNFIEKAVGDLEIAWKAIVDVGIGIITLAIGAIDLAIAAINAVIAILNAIITALVTVINVVISIIDAIASLFGGSGPDKLNVNNFTIPSIPFIEPIKFLPLTNDLGNRLNTLLLENDNVDTPKLLLVDTSRAEFINSRIAYLHIDNRTTIHARHLWDRFYFIDAFVGSPHNRFTKISPALNSESERNRVVLSLADFKNLVSNPQFQDQFGETVIADSIQWHIEQNGAAVFDYRKNGWLADPQNPNAIKRAQEIAINLQLQILVPNGQ